MEGTQTTVQGRIDELMRKIDSPADRAIEIAFPFIEISKLARIEAYRKNIYRPIYHLHKWWARRTGSVFRAILLGCLSSNESILERFYRPNQSLGLGKIILDPFMGSGPTIGEALRLGAKVIGVDINPVAWFMVKKAVEPVDLDELDKTYESLEKDVSPGILRLYNTKCPKCGKGALAKYVYWVKIATCRECDAEVPLRKSMMLAKHMSKPNTGLVTCPSCGHLFVSGELNRRLACPACSSVFDVNMGFTRGAIYECPKCHAEDKVVEFYHRHRRPPEHKMIGVAFSCSECGKGFKKPDQGDIESYETIRKTFEEKREQLVIPRSVIPPGYNTDQMRNYNYLYWYQMFNERQLIGLSTLLEAILKIDDKNIREFMLLLFSGVLEFNNMFCSPKGLGTGAVRHLFAHHAYIPPREVLEANLWGVERSSGGFSTLYRERLRRGKQWALRPAEHKITPRGMANVPIPEEQVLSAVASSFTELTKSDSAHAMLLNKSSTKLHEIPSRSVHLIVTDPPYLANVMYSELAGFFYAWLRLGLKGAYLGFAEQSVHRNEEAIKNLAVKARTGTYEEILSEVFTECNRILKDDGLLVFTFHHGSSEAWDSLGNALKNSRFEVRRFHPVYSEMDVSVPILGKESVKFDAILVCRKHEQKSLEIEMGDRELAEAISRIATQYIERLEKDFQLSAKDKSSIAQAAWITFFTQGRAQRLASEINWKEVCV